MYVSEENTDVSPKKIHTVEDVISSTMEIDESEPNNKTSCQNGGDNIAETENEQNNEDSLTEKRWRRVTGNLYSEINDNSTTHCQILL